ncbi:MAG: hypothetical protein ACI4PR_02565 [Acutalibacteraceae bacterium]
MFAWLISLFWQPIKPVETRDEALKIGQYEVQKKFPDDYSSCEVSLWYESETDLWHFRYIKKHEPDEIIFGGIMPGVNIRKSDGKITYLKGQK